MTARFIPAPEEVVKKHPQVVGRGFAKDWPRPRCEGQPFGLQGVYDWEGYHHNKMVWIIKCQGCGKLAARRLPTAKYCNSYCPMNIRNRRKAKIARAFTNTVDNWREDFYA